MDDALFSPLECSELCAEIEVWWNIDPWNVAPLPRIGSRRPSALMLTPRPLLIAFLSFSSLSMTPLETLSEPRWTADGVALEPLVLVLLRDLVFDCLR